MRALLLALVLAFPAAAETPGPVATYVVAARLLDRALAAEDPLLATTAVRLARTVTLRPAPGWTLKGNQAEAPAPAGYPRDPGEPAAGVLAGLMAEGDTDTLMVVGEALATALPQNGTAASRTATLPAGEVHSWRIAFFGSAAAEAGVVLTGPGALTFSLAPEVGPPACQARRADPAAVCAFTPAQNGWFIVTLSNPGPAPVAYRLLTN